MTIPLTDEEFTKKKIDVLLNEYEACHRNRNHYDSLIWTIGGIFFAVSLASMSASFLEDVTNYYGGVELIAASSIVFMLLWYVNVRNITHFVMQSIVRLHEIELELCKMGFDVRLHFSIAQPREMKETGLGMKGGDLIGLLIILGFFFIWLLRFILSSLFLQSICILLAMLTFSGFHCVLTRKKPYKKKIREIIDARAEKCERKG